MRLRLKIRVLGEAQGDSKPFVQDNIAIFQQDVPQGDMSREEYFGKINSAARSPYSSDLYPKVKEENIPKIMSNYSLQILEDIPEQYLPDRRHPRRKEYMGWLGKSSLITRKYGVDLATELPKNPQFLEDVGKLSKFWEESLIKGSRVPENLRFRERATFEANLALVEKYGETLNPLKYRIKIGDDLDGGWRMIRISAIEPGASLPQDIRHDLNIEGCDEAMSHCVGSHYTESVLSGDTIIFSLRSPDGKPYITMRFDVAKDEFVECKGPSNSKPKNDYLYKAYFWLKKNWERHQYSTLEYISEIVKYEDIKISYKSILEKPLDQLTADDYKLITKKMNESVSPYLGKIIVDLLLDAPRVEALEKVAGQKIFKGSFYFPYFLRYLAHEADDNFFKYVLNKIEPLTKMYDDYKLGVKYRRKEFVTSTMRNNELVNKSLPESYISKNLEDFLREDMLFMADNKKQLSPALKKELLDAASKDTLINFERNLNRNKNSNFSQYDMGVFYAMDEMSRYELFDFDLIEKAIETYTQLKEKGGNPDNQLIKMFSSNFNKILPRLQNSYEEEDGEKLEKSLQLMLMYIKNATTLRELWTAIDTDLFKEDMVPGVIGIDEMQEKIYKLSSNSTFPVIYYFFNQSVEYPLDKEYNDMIYDTFKKILEDRAETLSDVDKEDVFNFFDNVLAYEGNEYETFVNGKFVKTRAPSTKFSNRVIQDAAKEIEKYSLNNQEPLEENRLFRFNGRVFKSIR